MLKIKEVLKEREAKKATAVADKAKAAAAVKKPVAKKSCKESVTTGYAASATHGKSVIFTEATKTAEAPSFLAEARERSTNLHKQAANFIQRSDAAPKIEAAIREKNDVKARSLIMRQLQCDKDTSEKVLQALRLL